MLLLFTPTRPSSMFRANGTISLIIPPTVHLVLSLPLFSLVVEVLLWPPVYPLSCQCYRGLLFSTKTTKLLQGLNLGVFCSPPLCIGVHNQTALLYFSSFWCNAVFLVFLPNIQCSMLSFTHSEVMFLFLGHLFRKSIFPPTFDATAVCSVVRSWSCISAHFWKPITMLIAIKYAIPRAQYESWCHRTEVHAWLTWFS